MVATIMTAKYIIILQATHEQLYKYTAIEEFFGEGSTKTFQITVHFRVFCMSGKHIPTPYSRLVYAHN